MVTAVKETQGNSLVVRLTGTIEESVEFEAIIGATPQDVKISTKGVTRINSVGVKAWIKYFQGLAAKGTQLTFFECSLAIVEQVNLISNFLAGGKIESVYAPYLCGDCGADYVVVFQVADLKAKNFEMPPMKCTKCNGANVQFDDIPEDYFFFAQQG